MPVAVSVAENTCVTPTGRSFTHSLFVNLHNFLPDKRCLSATMEEMGSKSEVTFPKSQQRHGRQSKKVTEQAGLPRQGETGRESDLPKSQQFLGWLACAPAAKVMRHGAWQEDAQFTPVSRTQGSP